MTESSTDALWIFRLDGTIQCNPDAREIPLETMRAQLETLIGAEKVLEMEKRSLPMIALCDMPTGRANAYRVTREGWELLQHGIAGNPGFAPWPDGQPRAGGGGQGSTSVEALIGRPLRVYATGDGLTMDFRPDRVNVETTPDRTIVRVWFG